MWWSSYRGGTEVKLELSLMKLSHDEAFGANTIPLGIHLHADRFKDINNSARQVLETYGYIDDTKGKKK